MPVDLDEREKKIEELADKIRWTPIECGMENYADRLLKPYLTDNTEENQAFITRMFQKYACRKDYGILALILDAIQFFMDDQEPKYLGFVDDGLAMSPECQEQALAIIEQWRTRECLFILNKNLHKITGTLMRSYALRVLWELRVEFVRWFFDRDRWWGEPHDIGNLIQGIPDYGFGFKTLVMDKLGNTVSKDLARHMPEGFVVPSVSEILESIWKFHRTGIEKVVSEYHPSNKDPNTPHIDVTVTFKPGYLYQNAAAMSFDGDDQGNLTELRLMLLLWFKLNGMLPIWNDREEDPQFVTRDSVPEGDPVEYVYRFCTIDGKQEPSTRFETY